MANISFYSELERYKTLLQDELRKQVSHSDWVQVVGKMPAEAWPRIVTMATAGKQIRGALAGMMCEAFGGTQQVGVTLGAAWEMFNTGILIHDDVIDQDRLRRGLPSIFALYETDAREQQFKNPLHYGTSAALCLGDICLFFSNYFLGQLQIPGEQLTKILTWYAKTAIETGFGELKDTRVSFDKQDLEEHEILAIFGEKTARYTFVLPLVSAALATGQSAEVVRQLGLLGEELGILFQLKDDELGLFGTTLEIGKPVGSDIRERKQTLYYLYAKRILPPEEWQKLQSIFGNHEIDEPAIQTVQKVMRESGVKDAVEAVITEHQTKITLINQDGPWNSTVKSLINDLVVYQLERKK